MSTPLIRRATGLATLILLLFSIAFYAPTASGEGNPNDPATQVKDTTHLFVMAPDTTSESAVETAQDAPSLWDILLFIWSTL